MRAFSVEAEIETIRNAATDKGASASLYALTCFVGKRLDAFYTRLEKL